MNKRCAEDGAPYDGVIIKSGGRGDPPLQIYVTKTEQIAPFYFLLFE